MGGSGGPLAIVFALALVLVPACAAGPAGGRTAESARPPAVAGAFYPGDAGKLKEAVKDYMDDALPPRGERPLAIVVPHAGYAFSAQIAADAFKQAAGFSYDVVVILGTNHTTPGFDGVSVYQGGGYRTPLGVVRIDRKLAEALLAADKVVTFRPEVHAREHSVEVQVPFVQTVFPGVPVVTAVVGDANLGLAKRFGTVLAKALKGRKALIVASSDLSHFPSRNDAEQVDRKTLEAMASLDPAALSASSRFLMKEARRGLATCACGEGPVMTAMVAAKALGARRGVVISYANSGETVMGEPGRVVGYGSVVFTAGSGDPDTSVLTQTSSGNGAPLTQADKRYLLRLARRSIEQYLTTGTLPLPRLYSPGLRAPRGAFVTLKRKGDLRGCIGYMAGDLPLALTVARTALDSAFKDGRFRSLRPYELKGLTVEISAMTPMERVDGPGAVVVGRDGVLIEKGGHRAVFLPQVAPEQGWTREEMLEHLCLKAGLDADAWRHGANFYTFRAEVFGE